MGFIGWLGKRDSGATIEQAPVFEASSGFTDEVINKYLWSGGYGNRIKEVPSYMYLSSNLLFNGGYMIHSPFEGSFGVDLATDSTPDKCTIEIRVFDDNKLNIKETKMKKIKCVALGTNIWITVGTIYEVKKESDTGYLIDVNHHNDVYYDKDLFVEVDNLFLDPENLKKAYKEGCSDVKKVLKNLYPDFEFKEKTYKVGDIFKIAGDFYILGRASLPSYEDVYGLTALLGDNSCSRFIKIAGDFYILGRASRMFMDLTALLGDNSCSRFIKVGDPYKITNEEMRKLVSNGYEYILMDRKDVFK